jgi:hypothetical protein
MEDGTGLCGGAVDGGESNCNSPDVICGPSVRGVGWRTLIVGPHATAIVEDNNDNDDDRCHVGGCHAPPPLRSIPPDAAH